jgi:hypothetical protein
MLTEQVNVQGEDLQEGLGIDGKTIIQYILEK